MQCIGMFMIYFPTTFFMPRNNGPLGIAIKAKAKENIHTVVTLLFCMLQNVVFL
jgi:hypothetical protein